MNRFGAPGTGILGACLALALVAHLPYAAAQTFPSKNVRITSVYPAGAGPDIVARIVAEKLSKSWGRTVLVDPRPAAHGGPAIEAIKKAAADGHELLWSSNGHMVINPQLATQGNESHANYDTERDFAPVAMIYRTQFFLMVGPQSRHKTVPGMIAEAKANPGKLIYGIPYVGSPIHLGGMMLESYTGTQMTAVPFSNQQIFIALANGDIDWAFNTTGSAGSMLKANKVKLLALAAKTRSAAYPDIPTLEEAGGPAGVDISAWVAIFAPKAVPAAIVQKINADVLALLREPDVQQRLDTMGFAPTLISPAQLGEIIRSESAVSGKIIRSRKLGAQ